MALSWVSFQTIKKVLEKMKGENENIVQFLGDVEDGTFSDWHIYQIELGKILGEDKKGRANPKRASKPRFELSAQIGSAYLKEKNGIKFYIPQLKLWKARTLRDKVLMVNNSNTTPEIKAELICSLIK